jgi:chromosome partitioning protein
MVIGVVNQKGGVGKTTVALNIACSLAESGHRMTVLDADPQGSILQWKAIGKAPDLRILHRPKPLTRGFVKARLREADAVVIDTPPALNTICRSTLGVCDLVILPVGPSPLDIWSCRETLEQVVRSRRRNPTLAARLLISRKIPNTRVGREARDALGDYGLEVFHTEISQRIAFVEAMIAGRCVTRHAPASAAADEIRELCREILNLEGGKP